MKRNDAYLQDMPQSPSAVEQAYADYARTQKHNITPAAKTLASYLRLKSDIEAAMDDFLSSTDPSEALMASEAFARQSKREFDTCGPVYADRAIRDEQPGKSTPRKKASVTDLIMPTKK